MTAIRYLAQAYYLGHDGVRQNFSEATRWSLKLTNGGHSPQCRTSRVHSSPGLLYSRSKGVAQDYAQAFRWHPEAAMRGHVQAQHNLGMLYYKGKGTRQDPVSACYWIAIAERQRDDKARESFQTVAADMTWTPLSSRLMSSQPPVEDPVITVATRPTELTLPKAFTVLPV